MFLSLATVELINTGHYKWNVLETISNSIIIYIMLGSLLKLGNIRILKIIIAELRAYVEWCLYTLGTGLNKAFEARHLSLIVKNG